MVDRDKVILMTKLASYEQGEGKKYVPIANYFRTDYIGAQILKSFIAGTIAFMAILGIYIFYNFELIMEEVYNTDFVVVGKQIGKVYLICMGIYLIASYVLAVFRYSRARKSLRVYLNNLKKLEKF